MSIFPTLWYQKKLSEMKFKIEQAEKQWSMRKGKEWKKKQANQKSSEKYCLAFNFHS